jgi:hypothetical protein
VLDRGGHRGVVGDVDRERDRAAAGVFDRVDGAASVRLVPVDDRDRGSPLRRQLCGRRAIPLPAPVTNTTDESSMGRE